MGDQHDLILTRHSQIFEYARETFCRRFLGYLELTVSKTKNGFLLEKHLTTIDLLEGLWSVGGTFSPPAPVLGPEQKKVAMSSSSTVHGGQYDAKYVTFEYLLHAAFVADTICLP